MNQQVVACQLACRYDARIAPFHHEAFFYGDDETYVEGTVPFIEAGLGANEPVLVSLPTSRLELVRSQFGPSAAGLLRFEPMEEMGHNPAWIIPAWTDFIDHTRGVGRRARGIGEPAWVGRSADELVECARHEALLNVAFAGADGFTLLCPYDTTGLDPSVIDEAGRNHAHTSGPGPSVPSPTFDPDIPAGMDAPLPPAPPYAIITDFDIDGLGAVRDRVRGAAAAAGIDHARQADLVLAVTEAVSNSIRHAGPSGQLAIWASATQVLCEIRDRGRIADPLAGRVRPSFDGAGGRGLWLMNCVCDLVQIRSGPDGQVIRLHLDI